MSPDPYVAVALLKGIIRHWNEFGPADGLDEMMHYAHEYLEGRSGRHESSAPASESGVDSQSTLKSSNPKTAEDAWDAFIAGPRAGIYTDAFMHDAYLISWLRRALKFGWDARPGVETTPRLNASALDPGCIRQIADNLQEADEAELLEGLVCEAAVTALRDIAVEIERRALKTSCSDPEPGT